MKCVYEKDGVCEKHSDEEVKEPCLESPCKNEKNKKHFSEMIFKRFLRVY